MSLLNLLNGDGIQRLARELNIDPEKADGLAKMLAPTIGSAAKKRAEAGGLEGLLGQLRGEGNARYIDEPEKAASDEARADGESFLESLFGSRDATRDVATAAAERAGMDPAEVEKFLPSLAAKIKGGLQKEAPDEAIDGVMAQMGEMMPGGKDTREAPAAGGGSADGGGGLMGLVGGLMGGGSGAAAGGGAASLISGLLGGGDKAGGGGFDLSSVAKMLDADGDGSPMDDILARIMK